MLHHNIQRLSDYEDICELVGVAAEHRASVFTRSECLRGLGLLLRVFGLRLEQPGGTPIVATMTTPRAKGLLLIEASVTPAALCASSA